jgi:hypothetical protein
LPESHSNGRIEGLSLPAPRGLWNKKRKQPPPR